MVGPMSPTLEAFYRQRLREFAEASREADDDEREALHACMVTCLLRLCGVP